MKSPQIPYQLHVTTINIQFVHVKKNLHFASAKDTIKIQIVTQIPINNTNTLSLKINPK